MEPVRLFRSFVMQNLPSLSLHKGHPCVFFTADSHRDYNSDIPIRNRSCDRSNCHSQATVCPCGWTGI